MFVCDISEIFGPAATGSTVTEVTAEIHPVKGSCATILYDPGVKPVNKLLD